MAGTATLTIGSTIAPVRKAATLAADRALALDAVVATMKALESRASDGSDSRADLASLPAREGVVLRVDDVSSRLNPNLLRKNLIERTALADYLVPGADAAAVQQRREDEGFSVDIFSGYGDLIDEDALERLFTPYSYASVNTDDEFALRRLYLEATGDRAASEAFHAEVQRQLVALEILAPGRLEERYGLALAPVDPLIGAEPQLNANFALAETLGIVLSYPAFEIADPREKAEAIAEAAFSGPLDAGRISEIVGVPLSHPVHAWIGSRTWFWRISATTDAAEWRAIVRMEAGESGEGVRALLCEFGRTEEGDDRLRRHE
ncbi:MAG: hypothetical protein JXA15_13870 [Spirochaetales bacterium]|nr:hypothetical protein [Spirochaetales bacterium]